MMILPASPNNASGTVIAGSRVVLTGDDAPIWHAAGWFTLQAEVTCSRRAVNLEVPVPVDAEAPRYVLCAIDCNGREPREIATIVDIGLGNIDDDDPTIGVSLATGHFNGETLSSVLVSIPRKGITNVHNALSEHLDGFECFAILTNLHVYEG
jgi:hypothetical protein